MQYTPGQVRQALGLPQETLRHWRAVFSSLDGIRGQGPAYRPSQILALAIIKRLVDDCGLPVGALKGVDAELFEVAQSRHWTVLEQGSLLVFPGRGAVEFIDGRAAVAGDQPFILLPLAPVIAQLRRALTGMEVLDDQQSFAFRPVPMSQDPAKARRA